VNVNYRRGRAKEYRIMKEYTKKGCNCQRNAGSHGEWDVTAIDIENMEIFLIQSKPKSMSDEAKNKIELNGKRMFDGVYRVKFSVQ